MLLTGGVILGSKPNQIGQSEHPPELVWLPSLVQGTPDRDHFVQNWTDEADVASSTEQAQQSESGSTEYCDSDCSCPSVKENWVPEPRRYLTPTLPHSNSEEEYPTREEDTLDMQLHLESD